MTLPNFLIIGAARSGTTSLYYYLRQHPDIFMSPIKEPDYYTDDDNLPPNAIRSRAKYEKLFARAKGERARGEASVRYLNAIAGIDRIHADLDDVRLIVSLRQPADRAYSSYLTRLTTGREPRNPEEALQPGSYPFEISRYYPRLRRYYDRFPREQIKVILFDDLIANPRTVLRELFRFLDVDDGFIADTSIRHNAGVAPRSTLLNRLFHNGLRVVRPFAPQWLLSKGLSMHLRRPILRKPEPMSPLLRRRLTEQYHDDILGTGELIGRNLSHWLA
jgi:sulfotransferase family protein